MKTPVLLCVLLFSQSWAFEFIIDGEWESETSGPLDQNHQSGRYRRNVLTSGEEEDFEAIQGNDITVKSYKVESRITLRFAHTTVKSSVVNSGPNAQSIGFNVQIPKRAFINNFTMNVNGITFVGSVKEKTVARKLYAQARARGKAAGIVRYGFYIHPSTHPSVHPSIHPFIRPTVEAMKAILDDLSMDDYFSIIDFNHNVRCWSEDLVQASSLQVDEAKKYVQSIKPNGGTNINEALLRAVQMLVRASNQGLIDPRSVSMIILVSDGDPTVGEIKLNTIQKNVKRVMREEFSLFSLGIGFDVDFDFLERMAMDNRGVAQRIYANHDAAEQLKTFYSQVSSPLLRSITINFPENTVNNVTQNRFDKFFSGSELIVAGKLQPSDLTTLQSFTTAAAANMDLNIQTEADIRELDSVLGTHQHSFTGFARQMWAYITVNQLLAERSVAPTASKKRRITQRILALALEQQFVTPLTAMLVEGHDQGRPERLIADSPRDSKHGCCSATAPLSGPPPVQQLVYSNPPWLLPTVALNPNEVAGVHESIIPEHITGVDSDPHFIIHLPKSNIDICFNIDSKPGHILNLISDPGTGVTINSQLVGSKKMKNNKIQTYFGTISIYSKTDSVQVIVGTDRIDLMEGRNNHSFSWGATVELALNRMRVTIVKEQHVTVTIDGKISVMVLLHRVWKKHPVQVDFLGIYMSSDNKYSTQVHGLIGQFAQEPKVKVYGVHEGADPKKKEATMEVKGNKLAVTRGWQKDYRRDKKRGSDVYCWFIHNSGKGFIDGSYTSYILPQLDSFLTAI
ncbi:inter-alpha-trypsin inhibitor heavy chain H2-like [Sinocyclocheilus anshuiensis]|uniref:inter-alpha-trypsin inhibitor heavy chain H2-like n=1 Tax=Sinocyclocheilus anshuiensis TaxID=1608454 RepID=UPI0007BAAAF2|nr:PREDICTED: inter-alpha-trypsin inhibitor heavy chain H2-like [Sinocyclocheilus anshuiensis]